jgi:hypothetical protein
VKRQPWFDIPGITFRLEPSVMALFFGNQGSHKGLSPVEAHTQPQKCIALFLTDGLFFRWQGFYSSVPKHRNMEQKTDPSGTNSTEVMPTMAQCMNKAVANGYTENFKVVAKGLTTEGSDKFYTPDQIRISNFYRFEGWSAPEDNSILYLIETEDGRKGMLIDAYGAYADAKLSGFIRDVEDIQKKQRK